MARQAERKLKYQKSDKKGGKKKKSPVNQSVVQQRRSLSFFGQNIFWAAQSFSEETFAATAPYGTVSHFTVAPPWIAHCFLHAKSEKRQHGGS